MGNIANWIKNKSESSAEKRETHIVFRHPEYTCEICDKARALIAIDAGKYKHEKGQR